MALCPRLTSRFASSRRSAGIEGELDEPGPSCRLQSSMRVFPGRSTLRHFRLVVVVFAARLDGVRGTQHGQRRKRHAGSDSTGIRSVDDGLAMTLIAAAFAVMLRSQSSLTHRVVCRLRLATGSKADRLSGRSFSLPSTRSASHRRSRRISAAETSLMRGMEARFSCFGAGLALLSSRRSPTKQRSELSMHRHSFFASGVPPSSARRIDLSTSRTASSLSTSLRRRRQGRLLRSGQMSDFYLCVSYVAGHRCRFRYRDGRLRCPAMSET